MEGSKGAKLMHACAEMRRQMNRLLSNGELAQGEYLVLRRLSGAGRTVGARPLGPLRAAFLSDELDMKRPAISRILNSLEARGFISRVIDETNRRSFEIRLTEKGRAALERADRSLGEIAGKMQAALGDEDTERLTELINRVADVYRDLAAGRSETDGE